MREEAVERLRLVVRDSVGKHLYTSAIFLADKVAAATGDPADVYMLAQALFLGRHFRRALHVLNNSRLLRDLRFRFLAAKCLVSSTRHSPFLFHSRISSNALRASRLNPVSPSPVSLFLFGLACPRVRAFLPVVCLT